MSISANTNVFDYCQHNTPKIKKEETPGNVSVISKITSNPPILMDEYGQTPDHFYLAKRPPVFQAKRKLNLKQKTEEASSDTQSSVGHKLIIDSITTKEKARFDTSLGQLTKKVLRLLSDSADGVINLNHVCDVLHVQKRRLYDITNVLEGAGLIQRISRNIFQWIYQSDSDECHDKIQLEQEIDNLEAKENRLDELIYHMKAEINAFKESEGKYLYVTSDDLSKIDQFSKNTTVGVRLSPSDQVVEIHEKKVVLNSKSNEIEAFLMSENSSFTNILHPGAEFRENSYNIQMSNRNFINTKKIKEEPLEPLIPSNSVTNKRLMKKSKRAEIFISEQDDMAPIGSSFLLQTDDQDYHDDDLGVIPEKFSYTDYENIENFIDYYSHALDEDEGIGDLFA